MKKLMKCGRAQNATVRDFLNNSEEKPICIICGTDQTVDAPDLSGRAARCMYGCGAHADSKLELPFFEYRPDRELDGYFCGCRGWD